MSQAFYDEESDALVPGGELPNVIEVDYDDETKYATEATALHYSAYEGNEDELAFHLQPSKTNVFTLEAYNMNLSSMSTSISGLSISQRV